VNWSVLRREWGAVTFVLTVVVGMIVVPLALYFTNQGPAAIAAPPVTTASSARASSAQTASPATTSPTPSASPTASP
jgi:hypothetical protein